MSTGPHWEITIVTNGVNDVHKLISDIKKNLIDYKLRQIVADETRQVRELIIAKAFSYEDETPPPTTEISDPVGFDASSI
jgi:His-Xaa-Ser system protein HxsD